MGTSGFAGAGLMLQSSGSGMILSTTDSSEIV